MKNYKNIYKAQMSEQTCTWDVYSSTSGIFTRVPIHPDVESAEQLPEVGFVPSRSKFLYKFLVHPQKITTWLCEGWKFVGVHFGI